MKKWIVSILMLACAHAALAFPSWMGVYGDYKRHDDRINPGQFAVILNQDYFGLQAEVGIQVDNGNWTTHRMAYAGNVQGNSRWTFTPGALFPAGSKVKYYFHGFDAWGGRIYDNRNNLNYEFTVSPAATVTRIADGTYRYIDGGNPRAGAQYSFYLWLDFKIKNLGSPASIGIVWTDDNWAHWTAQSAEFEAALANGEQQWGVDVTPVGRGWVDVGSTTDWKWYPLYGWDAVPPVLRAMNGPVAVKYAIFYEVAGTFYWDNNGGLDYTLQIQKP